MISCAVIGAGGYTGAELIKLLIQHPVFKLTYLGVRAAESTLEDIHPFLKDVYEQPVELTDAHAVAGRCEVAFLALPHKTSMEIASQLIALGVKVIDLSADYRLEQETYEEHYTPHTDAENLSHGVYGLPELYREQMKSTKLIANPGCYPTASLLALIPFLEYIDASSPIFIDAKSGVSGAGKGLKDITHYVHINENMFAYNPFKHRHAPEIKEKIEKLSKQTFSINFVPHLLPLTRGMLVSVYATLKKGIDAEAILQAYYKDEPFVRIRKHPVDIKSTAGTNFCDLYAATNDNALFITSSIDNLLRGASSQAIVGANLMCGLDEHLGVPKIAYIP